jgi:nucleoid-associated protein YgaU
LWGAEPTAPTANDVTARRASDQAASRSATRKPLTTPTNTAKGGSVGKGKHVVQKGETLSSIAKANKIESWRKLYDANRPTLKNANVLHIGQVLNLA